ncbi:MAG: galactose mutarotase [Veillonella sp.]|uniref:aldose epimerase family protein n=1 Tax=Veillonella sp. TaxID=1926307 RepID=UPI0025D3AE9F|nr:aldose epimerase family protein [Veillonella sp.]MBS4914256.1 galactose mutarotase [Veillonella sp.]
MKCEGYGTSPSGAQIVQYELESKNFIVRVLSWGAIIQDFIVKSTGRNIVLGYDSVKGYLQGQAYFGATVGRVANRIANAECIIGGVTYFFHPNNGPNLLHSGCHSLSFMNWQLVEHSESELVLEATITEEEDRFPGDFTVQAHMKLDDEGLSIRYEYSTTKVSTVNITGHSYFNLTGEATVKSHDVRLYADEYAPFGANQIPTGELKPVADTAYDFTDWRNVGEALEANKKELAPYRGYDHFYMTRKGGSSDGMKSAEGLAAGKEAGAAKGAENLQSPGQGLLKCSEFRGGGLTLTVLSDAPGFQFYTGNWVKDTGRDGTKYGPHSGMCIEPSFIPNDCNLPGYRQSLTEASTESQPKVYERVIVYKVDVE